MNDFLKELTWRGMIHSQSAGCAKWLEQESRTGYLGIDPTGPSLHIGHLVTIMMMNNLQRCGHKPLFVLGGSTGMIGDPSGKSEERNLLSKEDIIQNYELLKKQLSKLVDFDKGSYSAELLNNNDWTKEYLYLDFLRDIGKHLTLNYMMAKDSVQSRIEKGISYTEFSYQLLQAYDFFWLHKNMNCGLQMGGSDQWGNITSGIELIRRKEGNDAFGITCPLLTREDGSKFGKTEKGDNIWLSAEKTSPYKFYQFWYNTSDETAEKCMKIFSYKNEPEINDLIFNHKKDSSQRILQSALGKELTCRIHSENDFKMVKEATGVLFGSSPVNALENIDSKTIGEIFDGVGRYTLSKDKIENPVKVVELISDFTGIFPSRGEAKRMIKSGGLMINKEKISNESEAVNTTQLISGKYLLVQKGKKNYYLVEFV
ncbi:MAG: tyrosine--tRNA ligase [Bacteroidetes bacterium RIFCSPLOWO2_02_FULL_36_8]|nr:MAG: tyrosine--tRNA ligase [Bacteroidetes bacterium RIFCSPLOWO2_02_FULL_36_8]OFY69445.1 MAG: tyrosine--tRNA ligase [Bacteroidetes bacterium RIFCSPLOWO2_12_FULL_37_12]